MAEKRPLEYLSGAAKWLVAAAFLALYANAIWTNTWHEWGGTLAWLGVAYVALAILDSRLVVLERRLRGFRFHSSKNAKPRVTSDPP